jgi:putative ABC transport system substrate-binding protein
MKLTRVALTVGFVLSVLATPLAAQAQAGKVWRVGFLGPTSAAAAAHLIAAFREGLRDHGYVEGQNVAIEYRWADGDVDRLPLLARELVATSIDILVAPTPPAVRAAKNATSTIPIVMFNVADPVGSGLVADLTRPGGNVTGQTNDEPGLGEKLIALVREVTPGIRLVALLRNPANPAAGLQLNEIDAASQGAGLGLQSFEARDPKEFDAVFGAIKAARVGALIVRAHPMFFGQRRRLADLALTNQLPTVFERREYAEAGGLVGYGPSLVDQFRHAATYVDKILKGAKPADLPVEPPARSELVINLKTAKALGLTLPQSLLQRADQVIE